MEGPLQDLKPPLLRYICMCHAFVCELFGLFHSFDKRWTWIPLEEAVLLPMYGGVSTLCRDQCAEADEDYIQCMHSSGDRIMQDTLLQMERSGHQQASGRTGAAALNKALQPAVQCM